MKKILSLSSIKNRTLRERADVTMLFKTACHRYHNNSINVFVKWLRLLNKEELKTVKKDLQLDEHTMKVLMNQSEGK